MPWYDSAQEADRMGHAVWVSHDGEKLPQQPELGQKRVLTPYEASRLLGVLRHVRQEVAERFKQLPLDEALAAADDFYLRKAARERALGLQKK